MKSKRWCWLLRSMLPKRIGENLLLLSRLLLHRRRSRSHLVLPPPLPLSSRPPPSCPSPSPSHPLTNHSPPLHTRKSTQALIPHIRTGRPIVLYVKVGMGDWWRSRGEHGLEASVRVGGGKGDEKRWVEVERCVAGEGVERVSRVCFL